MDATTDSRFFPAKEEPGRHDSAQLPDRSRTGAPASSNHATISTSLSPLPFDTAPLVAARHVGSRDSIAEIVTGSGSRRPPRTEPVAEDRHHRIFVVGRGGGVEETDPQTSSGAHPKHADNVVDHDAAPLDLTHPEALARVLENRPAEEPLEHALVQSVTAFVSTLLAAPTGPDTAPARTSSWAQTWDAWFRERAVLERAVATRTGSHPGELWVADIVQTAISATVLSLERHSRGANGSGDDADEIHRMFTTRPAWISRPEVLAATVPHA